MIIKKDWEIQRAISAINKRRAEKAMNLPVNAEVKAGYREALRVLCEKDENLEHIASNLTGVQARCIAWLAVDFLQGECTQKVLCNVPIKKPNEK